MSTAPTAWIVSQGEELLTGQTVDTNANFLAERLTASGFRVLGASTAGDRTDAIVRALRDAAEQADVVICTGGLGPTADDLTAEAAALAFGVPLVQSAAALAVVEEAFARMKRSMVAANRKQGLIPSGADVLPNPAGTAPGFALDAAGARTYCVPGVPREMKRMWREQVAPDLARRIAVRAPLRALFRVYGLGESQLQELLGDIPAVFEGVELGFRTRPPENQVKLVAEPDTPRFDEACDAVRERLGDKLVSEDEQRGLAAIVGEALVARGETLALAESCTGGLIGHLCVSEPGSSRWLDRGFVTYSNSAKIESIGVPEATIEEHGAVSEATAIAMAEGAARTAGTAWAVAVTGVAGPGGGTEGKPVGTVWIAVRGPDGARARKLFLPTGDRNTTRTWSAHLALEMLRRGLLRAGPGPVSSRPRPGS